MAITSGIKGWIKGDITDDELEMCNALNSHQFSPIKMFPSFQKYRYTMDNNDTIENMLRAVTITRNYVLN